MSYRRVEQCSKLTGTLLTKYSKGILLPKEMMCKILCGLHMLIWVSSLWHGHKQEPSDRIRHLCRRWAKNWHSIRSEEEPPSWIRNVVTYNHIWQRACSVSIPREPDKFRKAEEGNFGSWKRIKAHAVIINTANAQANVQELSHLSNDKKSNLRATWKSMWRFLPEHLARQNGACRIDHQLCHTLRCKAIFNPQISGGNNKEMNKAPHK